MRSGCRRALPDPREAPRAGRLHRGLRRASAAREARRHADGVHRGDADRPPPRGLRRFESAIREVDEIIECHLVSGGYDYLLRFLTRGVNHYQQVIEGLLERNIGIEKYFSYIVIKSPFVKTHCPIERLFPEPRRLAEATTRERARGRAALNEAAPLGDRAEPAHAVAAAPRR